MNSCLIKIISFPFPRLWMPVALYIPLGLLISAASLLVHPRSVNETLILFGVGVFAWTLIEYILHRFVFHWITDKEPWRMLSSGFHMSHHHAVENHEPDIVITRPAGSLPFALLFYLLFSLLTLSFSAAALIMTGVFVGYLFYESAHYSAHHFYPKGTLGKSLKHYHLQHHLKNPTRQFGVTSPLWDFIFRTF